MLYSSPTDAAHAARDADLVAARRRADERPREYAEAIETSLGSCHNLGEYCLLAGAKDCAESGHEAFVILERDLSMLEQLLATWDSFRRADYEFNIQLGKADRVLASVRSRYEGAVTADSEIIERAKAKFRSS